jgi:polysaccharide export outer membrane protein
MRFKKVILLLASILLLSSCAATKIAYFQDRQQGVAEELINPSDITLRPNDKILILVNSKDPLLTNLFNLPIVQRQLGSLNQNTYNQGIAGYTLDKDGNIDFPVMGKVHVAGLTREAVALKIKQELIAQNLVKDPVVTVEFMNLTVSVLGEVLRPGRFSIDKDRFTLLDALGMAGDLTIYGRRDNVLIQRMEEDGKLLTYQVDLNSGKDIYASPAYYLQQNDVIYVEPNPTRARQSTVNGNTVRTTSFWMSLASLITTIMVLIIK